MQRHEKKQRHQTPSVLDGFSMQLIKNNNKVENIRQALGYKIPLYFHFSGPKCNQAFYMYMATYTHKETGVTTVRYILYIPIHSF